MRALKILVAAAAICVAVFPSQATKAQDKPIDYIRYEELERQCPTVMASHAPRKEELALHYNGKSDRQFDNVLHDCRAKEADLQYPRPQPKQRDIAIYERERRAAALKVPKCDIGTFSKEKGKCI